MSKSIFIKFTSLILSIAFLLTGCAKPVNNTEETTTATEKIEETAEPKKYTYYELLSTLKDILEKKDFCDEADLLILDTFDSIYENYADWSIMYKDMPSVDVFIINNYISPIEELDKFIYCNGDTEEGQNALEENSCWAYTSLTENNELSIFLVTSPGGGVTGHIYDMQNLLHEISHCTQLMLDCDYHNNEQIDCSLGIAYILQEGAATFFQRFANEYTSEIYGTHTIATSDMRLEIEYSNLDCMGYLHELNAYTKLMYFVGYETMHKFYTHEISFDDIAEIICNRYGKEKGEKFLIDLFVRTEHYLEDNGFKNDITYNLSIETEKMFLDFIYSDVENAKTIEELEEIERLYRSYVEISMPKVYLNDDDGSREEITDTLFDTTPIEDILEIKKAELTNNK